ncbi:MAG: hypothetical protein J4F41_08725, partial [Alphaproteobacteria bacterium]|nr:hypothetical protein [Alphaproteobacteria bacterium]
MTTITMILIAALLAMVGVVAWMATKLGKPAADNTPAYDPAAIGALKGQLDQIAQMASNLQTNVTSQLQNQERRLIETLREQAECTGQKLGDLLT